MHRSDINVTAILPKHFRRRIVPNAIELRRTRRGPWLQLFTSAGFEWNVADLPIRDLPPGLEGLRVVHITDFHLRSRWTRAYDELIDRLRADPPDLLLHTGDYVDNRNDHTSALPVVQRLLSNLSARLGIFGVMGNHDGDLLAAKILAWNIRLIGSRKITLQVKGATVELIGLAGADRDDVDMDFIHSVGPKPAGTIRIVLSHYPDALMQTPHFDADIFLAGHTHGGQVCMPGGFALIRHDSLPRSVLKGIHDVHGTWLVANRGFGFSGLPLRVFCPAEVVELRLTRAT